MNRERPSGFLPGGIQSVRQRSGRSRRWWLRRSLATAAGLAVWPVFPTVGNSRGGVAAPSRRELADDIERVLWQRILPAWYPRTLDTEQGGFWENFDQTWSRQPGSSKFLVYQARMTWTPAAVALRYPQHREPYLRYARHGLRFLRERMWDQQHGGVGSRRR